MPLWTIFTKWPAPGGPDMGVAAFGGQRQEGRLGHGHRLVGAADHQAVPLGQAPDAARGAGVDQGDALGRPAGRPGGRSPCSWSCRRR